MVADARRACGIVDGMHEIASRRALEHKPMSLADVIDKSRNFLRHELLSKGVVVSLDLTRDLPLVVGDRMQLQQVIVNLVVNALGDDAKCSRRSASERSCPILRRCITLSKIAAGDRCEHVSARLFDSFFTTKDTGMGMGLPILPVELSETHGGQIRADDKNLPSAEPKIQAALYRPDRTKLIPARRNSVHALLWRASTTPRNNDARCGKRNSRPMIPSRRFSEEMVVDFPERRDCLPALPMNA